MRVRWTHRARARLRLIHDFIADDSPGSALKVVDRITSHSKQLSSLPRSGREVPEYKREDIRELLIKPYRIIYIIKDEQIDILTIMHYRQILPQDIRQL